MRCRCVVVKDRGTNEIETRSRGGSVRGVEETGLKPGEVRVLKENGEEEQYYVSGGMLEVQPHVITVLADSALRAADVDEAAALQAKADAEKAINDGSAKRDFAEAQKELAEAMAQLRAIERLRSNSKGR